MTFYALVLYARGKENGWLKLSDKGFRSKDRAEKFLVSKGFEKIMDDVYGNEKFFCRIREVKIEDDAKGESSGASQQLRFNNAVRSN